MMQEDTPHPFSVLTPDFVMDAVETQGFVCDGRILVLNSYENRVYQIGIEDQQPIIAKFYRPARWSKEQILEEHQFCYELEDAELPVITPLKNSQQKSLFEYSDFCFSLYPRKGGHAPELDNLDHLGVVGRNLGRIHLIGARQPYTDRPTINIEHFGYDSVALIKEKFIPAHLQEAYSTLSEDLLARMQIILDEQGALRHIRVHGDCHIGNMLWRDDSLHFIDFDDTRMAPAIQDIWMLLSGDNSQQQIQLMEILDGYHEFADFPLSELRLVEVLRTLRMFYFSAWLARRWDDPAFPQGFPWFNTTQYWEQHVLDLRAQLAELYESPLQLVH